MIIGERPYGAASFPQELQLKLIRAPDKMRISVNTP
jgi:hypothetical protein